jgi:hypothetical protein
MAGLAAGLLAGIVLLPEHLPKQSRPLFGLRTVLRRYTGTRIYRPNLLRRCFVTHQDKCSSIAGETR